MLLTPPRRPSAVTPVVKTTLVPRDAASWAWIATVALLGLGLFGIEGGFHAAVALTIMQVLVAWRVARDWRAISVQIRLGYLAILGLSLALPRPWLFALPFAGTIALLATGYCLLARTISLMPWIRREPRSFDLLCRTFLTTPAGGWFPSRPPVCGGAGGACELEARIASRDPMPTQSTAAAWPAPLETNCGHARVPLSQQQFREF